MRKIVFQIFVACIILSNAHAETIEALKRRLRGKAEQETTLLPSQDVVKIIEEISFNPPLGNPAFWESSLNDFKKNNYKGAWEHKPLYNKEVELLSGSPQSFLVWGIAPLEVTARFQNDKLTWIEIIIWNKGDGDFNGNRAASVIYKKIEKCLKDLWVQETVENQEISSIVKRKWAMYTIGPTDLGLCFKKNEYFFVRLLPTGKRDNANEHSYKMKVKVEDLSKNVIRDASGDVYIDGIPMIDQGDKGYCAPATCARVMQYYGIEVDMHLLADWMNTSPSRGTRRRETLTILKRLCRGHAVRYKDLVSFRPNEIEKYIDKGMPLIWIIPRHIRLITGYNKKEKWVIYSDSWGQIGKFRKMSYKRARQLTERIYVLR